MSDEKKEEAAAEPAKTEERAPETPEKGAAGKSAGKQPFVPRFQRGNNPFTNPGGAAGKGKGYRGPAGPVGGRLPPRSGSRGT